MLLFYNNRSDDDKAVRRELRQVNRYGNQVFVDAHWIKSVAALPGDHARRQRRPVADRRGRRHAT